MKPVRGGDRWKAEVGSDSNSEPYELWQASGDGVDTVLVQGGRKPYTA